MDQSEQPPQHPTKSEIIEEIKHDEVFVKYIASNVKDDIYAKLQLESDTRYNKIRIFLSITIFICITALVPLGRFLYNYQMEYIEKETTHQITEKMSKITSKFNDRINSMTVDAKKRESDFLSKINTSKEDITQQNIDLELRLDYSWYANRVSLADTLNGYMLATSERNETGKLRAIDRYPKLIEITNKATKYILSLSDEQKNILEEANELILLLEPLVHSSIKVDNSSDLIAIYEKFGDAFPVGLKEDLQSYMVRIILSYGDRNKAKNSFIYKFYLKLSQSFKTLDDNVIVNSAFVNFYFNYDMDDRFERNNWDMLTPKQQGLLITKAVLNTNSKAVGIFPTLIQKNANKVYITFLRTNQKEIIKRLKNTSVKSAFVSSFPKTELQLLPSYLKPYFN